MCILFRRNSRDFSFLGECSQVQVAVSPRAPTSLPQPSSKSKRLVSDAKLFAEATPIFSLAPWGESARRAGEGACGPQLRAQPSWEVTFQGLGNAERRQRRTYWPSRRLTSESQRPSVRPSWWGPATRPRSIKVGPGLRCRGRWSEMHVRKCPANGSPAGAP
jgi:hypothetical protein